MESQQISGSSSPELSNLTCRLGSSLKLSANTQLTYEDTSTTTLRTSNGRLGDGSNHTSPADTSANPAAAIHSPSSANNELDESVCCQPEVASTPTASTLASPCLFLVKLPGELRTSIYEHTLSESTATIVVDLRKGIEERARSTMTSPTNILLACKQIYEECASLRYAINRVHIFVPVLSTASAASQEERERRDLIASRLQQIADLQVKTRQLRGVRLFLGRLSPLSHLRWTEFFTSWMGIKEAVVCLSGICSSLELSFEVQLANGWIAQHKFAIGGFGTEKENNEMLFSDGSVVEVTDSERERLRRIKATIFKTIRAFALER